AHVDVAGGDDLPDGVDRVPVVDVHTRDDGAATQPERGEHPPRDVAAEHDVVVPGRVPDVLHPEVVLVGEEVREPVVRGAGAEERAGGGAPLPDGVVPVLDPDVAAEAGVVGLGDVPGGEDVGVGAAEVLVDDDPAVHREPRGLGEGEIGRAHV